MTYQPKIYRAQGGAELVITSSGTLTMGGTMTTTGTETNTGTLNIDGTGTLGSAATAHSRQWRVHRRPDPDGGYYCRDHH